MPFPLRHPPESRRLLLLLPDFYFKKYYNSPLLLQLPPQELPVPCMPSGMQMSWHLICTR